MATCKSLEASLHKEPPQPETSWSREEKVEKENQALKEPVNRLKVAQRRLEDELTNKNHLIFSETKKRRTRTNTYTDCLATKERELKKSRAESLEKLSESESELESVERMWRREEQQLAAVKV
ncbi:unnamed protein product [Pleuronectes platessa]|uniref:Uncharacterized protein n=1 Tax=Pleuronectes platessa TaxID=8262 RepID=A0A9N7TP90_PLEPL|nr:unnamed protein product [Pleuronectes platessa]